MTEPSQDHGTFDEPEQGDYEFAERDQTQVDESDYRGTTRDDVDVDPSGYRLTTRGVVSREQPDIAPR